MESRRMLVRCLMALCLVCMAATARNAAAGNYEDAQRAAGEGDFPRCVSLLNKAMTVDDDPRAYGALGLLYIQGSMVEKDIPKGLKLADVAIRRGDTGTINSMALFYAEGKPLGKDHGKALELWKKAFALGSAPAGYNIAQIYNPDLKGPRQNLSEHQKWLLKAAKAGEDDAIYLMTFELLGDDPWLPESFSSTSSRQDCAYTWSLVGVKLGYKKVHDLYLFMEKQWAMPAARRNRCEAEANRIVASIR